MDWLILCIPLMIVGIAVATVPLVVMTRHQHKHDLHEGPRPLAGPVTRLNPTVHDSSSWTVCGECSAVVANQVIHNRSVHVTATP